jgi:hypothetical protein
MANINYLLHHQSPVENAANTPTAGNNFAEAIDHNAELNISPVEISQSANIWAARSSRFSPDWH